MLKLTILTVSSLYAILLVAIPTSHAADCGGVTTCACGDRVVSDYTMTAALDCSGAGDKNKHGLTVVSGVTLNCDSFDIIGGNVAGYYGIRIDKANDVLIAGCVPNNFERGIRVSDSYDIEIFGSTVRNNMQYGIDIVDTGDSPDTQRVVVRESLIRSNGDEGIHVAGRAGVVAQHDIFGNVVTDNNCEGIYLFNLDGTSSSGTYGARIAFNTIFGNGKGEDLTTAPQAQPASTPLARTTIAIDTTL